MDIFGIFNQLYKNYKIVVLKIITFLPSSKKVIILSTLATFQKVREKSHPYFFHEIVFLRDVHIILENNYYLPARGSGFLWDPIKCSYS